MQSDDLEARLRAVEDRLALIELEGRYARTFDARDGDAWAALFTDDGVYQSRDASRGNGTYVAGRDELAAFCREAPFTGIHYLHLPQLTFAGDEATARIHLQFWASFRDDGAPVWRFLGYYDVLYARSEDGWLIKRRVTTTFARSTDATFGYQPGNGLSAG